MRNDKIHPNIGWYALSATILVVGALFCLAAFLCLFFSIERSTQQIIVPGTHRLQFPVSGEYIIFYEYKSVIGDRVFSTSRNLISLLECSIKTQDGKQIVIFSHTSYEKYNLGGRIKACSAFKFTLDEPGTYVLTAKYSDKRESPQIVLGVRRTLHQIILIPGICLMMFATIVILVSAGIFWLTFLKRQKAKKRLVQNSLSHNPNVSL